MVTFCVYLVADNHRSGGGEVEVALVVLSQVMMVVVVLGEVSLATRYRTSLFQLDVNYVVLFSLCSVL